MKLTMLRHNDVRKEEEVEQIGHSFSLATHFSTLQRRNYVHVTKHDIKNVRQSSVASLHGVLIVDCSVEQSGISLFNTLCVQYSYALFASKIRFLCLPIQDWIYFLRNQTRP